MGMADFFSMEAGDYLERLDALVSGAAATPDTRELIRLSRALRGSAIMAGNRPLPMWQLGSSHCLGVSTKPGSDGTKPRASWPFGQLTT